MTRLLQFAFAVVVAALLPAIACADSGKRTNVVLVGATGNLAKKYLLQAFFDQSQMDPGLHLYPAATKSPDIGQPIIDASLAGNVSCVQSACLDFQRRVHPYTQLRKEEHWKALAQTLASDTAGSEHAGTLVYLSIPPSVYKSTAALVNKYLRPASGWLRVIFEKPFGEDLDSAKDLAAGLSAELAEEEIYRVDHYLGKAGVQAITDFRRAQAAASGNTWEDLLSNDHVEQVVVTMMEKENCAGRTGFYDQYGIVRDVLQNHLTEMATLVAMDLTPSGDDKAFNDAKVRTALFSVPAVCEL